VTSPFATLFISKGRPDLSRRVLKNTYDVLRPNKGSLLGKDFKKLWLASGGKA
jgi:hypothetical protein